jgi:hypothetical protein
LLTDTGGLGPLRDRLRHPYGCRRTAWRHFGGHAWRYLLEPVDEQHTRVTEQFDPTGSRSPLVLSAIRARSRNGKAINATLDRLQRWA